MSGSPFNRNHQLLALQRALEMRSNAPKPSPIDPLRLLELLSRSNTSPQMLRPTLTLQGPLQLPLTSTLFPKSPQSSLPRTLRLGSKRPQLFQKQHDRYIGLIAKWGWEDQGYPVGTNPGQNKFHPVGGVYPDIVVYHTTEYNIGTIAEVETKESVTNSEASSQWKKYGNLGHTFYLFVPQESVQVASRLIRKHKINCNRLFGFWVENNILHVCQLLT